MSCSGPDVNQQQQKSSLALADITRIHLQDVMRADVNTFRLASIHVAALTRCWAPFARVTTIVRSPTFYLSASPMVPPFSACEYPMDVLNTQYPLQTCSEKKLRLVIKVEFRAVQVLCGFWIVSTWVFKAFLMPSFFSTGTSRKPWSNAGFLRSTIHQGTHFYSALSLFLNSWPERNRGPADSVGYGKLQHCWDNVVGTSTSCSLNYFC